MRVIITILFIACLSSSVFAQTNTPGINAVTSNYQFKNNKDAQRFSMLTNETRCVVCQFQNIAESKAPIAASLRKKIYRLINENKSNDEIRAYLVKRYGEVILLKPRFNKATAFLWLFPLIGIMIFACIMLKIFKAK